MAEHFNKLTAANFQLALPLIPSETSIRATDELILNTFGVVIPSINIDQEEQRWQGAKIIVPGGTITFDAFTTNFMVDDNLDNWKVLFDWITYINNNYNSFVGDYNNYVIDASLRLTDNFGTQTRLITFKNMWIQSLGEVTLSQREGEPVLECNATFSYDRFVVA